MKGPQWAIYPGYQGPTPTLSKVDILFILFYLYNEEKPRVEEISHYSSATVKVWIISGFL